MPKVSIGLPVYNGESYLSDALDSLLSQTFRDFEVVICDNASTDGTERIAREYAERDGRIRYVRNPENIGAAPNFNRTFDLSTGEYFKWAASDDLCAPEFLERCVAILDGDAGAVLAYPRTKIINEQAEEIDRYEVKLPTDHANPVRRYNSVLNGHKCYEIFGLIRRSALLETGLIGSYSHGDGVLLARLALRGRLEEVPEYLFLSRRHDGQSARMEGDRHSYVVWFDPRNRGKLVFPRWRTYFEYFRSIHPAPLKFKDRLRCYKGFFQRTYGRRRVLQEEVTYQARRIAARFVPFVRPKEDGRPRSTGP